MKTTILESMYDDIAKLVGIKLNEIILNYFYVEFVFTGVESYRVAIKKEFTFGLAPNQPLKFVANALKHDLAVESANFVYLQGKCCVEATISPVGLNLTFDDGSTLSVEFDDKDFEPIEFIGYGGNQNENLKFYYVL